MQKFPTLYKRTSTGKIQIWFAEVEGNKYCTTSGQLEGKKTTADWTVCLPKNEGKANATTAEEQAVVEVEAMYKKQIKKDYRENIDDVDKIERFKPTLATKWADRKSKITEEYLHKQPKLDGQRLIARADGLWSRNGEPMLKAPHIWEEVKHYFENHPDLIIDGELYNHDFKDDFNTLMSDEGKKNLQYWVYDLPSHPGIFKERWEALCNIVKATSRIVLTPTELIHIDDVDEKAAEDIENGFEGSMIRLPGPYENKRSKYLIKWKEMQDEEFRIVDIQPGLGNRSGIAARVVLALEDGREFGAGPIGNFEYCLQLLTNRDLHIGKMGTVVFQNYTPDGIPRFPKFKTVRDYE